MDTTHQGVEFGRYGRTASRSAGIRPATKTLVDQHGGPSSHNRYNLRGITGRHLSLHTLTLHVYKRPPPPSQVPVWLRYPERTVLAGHYELFQLASPSLLVPWHSHLGDLQLYKGHQRVVETLTTKFESPTTLRDPAMEVESVRLLNPHWMPVMASPRLSASERMRFKQSHLEGFSGWTRHTRASSLADMDARRHGLPAFV